MVVDLDDVGGGTGNDMDMFCGANSVFCKILLSLYNVCGMYIHFFK